MNSGRKSAARACLVRHSPETADNISHGSMTTLIITCANIQGSSSENPRYRRGDGIALKAEILEHGDLTPNQDHRQWAEHS
jgi:hypothetical protein